MYACMTRKFCLLAVFAAASFCFSGCSDTQEPPKTTENNTGVSTIPWDRPEKWEGSSSVPGAEFMNSQ